VRRLLATGGALTLAFFQATVLANGVSNGVYPDLVMVWVVALSLVYGAREATWWAFWSGIVLDILSAGPFGVFTLSLLLIALMASLGESNIYQASLLLPLFTGLVASFVYYLLLFFFLTTLGGKVAWWSSWPAIGLASLMNTALMPLAHKLAERISSRRALLDASR